MMRYRYRAAYWKLIFAVIVIVAIVLALMVSRPSMVELSGPKEITMVIRPNEVISFNATIRSPAGTSSYRNYTWYADGSDIFKVEETSDNFVGDASRFPLDGGETRELTFQVTLVAQDPPEGRYFLKFNLNAESNGKTKRISNIYRLWVDLRTE